MSDVGTNRAGEMGVQIIDPAKCIWDAATLPPATSDMYAAKAKERRQQRRVPCKLGAERDARFGSPRAGWMCETSAKADVLWKCTPYPQIRSR
jgi:hypothetical protein